MIYLHYRGPAGWLGLPSEIDCRGLKVTHSEKKNYVDTFIGVLFHAFDQKSGFPNEVRGGKGS